MVGVVVVLASEQLVLLAGCLVTRMNIKILMANSLFGVRKYFTN